MITTMINYATRIFSDDYESRESEIRTLANHYGINETKDKGRVLFLLFKTRRQANDFAEEVFDIFKINAKVIEWYKESED